MEVDERWHNRFSAEILHDGVFGNGDGPRISSGDDMIAFDDEHRVLYCLLAGPINQTRPSEHDLFCVRLSASAGVGNKQGEKNTQDHPSVRSIDGFHFHLLAGLISLLTPILVTSCEFQCPFNSHVYGLIE